jgi:hypothetical protein
MTGGATITPPVAPNIAFSPNGFTPFTAVFTAAQVGPPPVPASVTPSAPQTVSLVNNGTAPLIVSAIGTNGAPGCAQFQFAFPATGTLNQCDIDAFTVVYTGNQTTPQKESDTCSIVVTTNAGTKTIPLLGITQ